MKKGYILVSAVAATFLLGAAFLFVTNPVDAVAACRDNTDNDGDTYTDWPSDPGCSSKNDNSELGTVQCDNGVSDDNDGLVDYPDDPGCSSVTENNELGTVQCDNNLDDDNDTFVDYPADPHCSSALDNRELIDNSCSDTDAFDVTTQGFVNGTYEGVPFTYTDLCVTSAVLREFYCGGTQPLNGTYDCTGNFTACSSGACV